MVKLIAKGADWRPLENDIRRALLLADDHPELVLHLSHVGHTLEKLEAHTSIKLQSPYQESSLTQRLLRSSPSQETLLKAIGCRGNYYPSVIDATACFGVDALLMAFNHCLVSCIEWNPLTCFLVADHFTHLQEEKIIAVIEKNLHYYAEDARVLIPELPLHDVIYLDPMFHERRKQAKVKKYMQMMQTVSALYPWFVIDEKELFDLASAYAQKRVVVKRPKGEAPLASNPNYSLCSQSVRWDIYIQ